MLDTDYAEIHSHTFSPKKHDYGKLHVVYLTVIIY